MTDSRYTLPKTGRLSWKRYIDQLFLRGDSFVAYPLRVIYLPVESVQRVPASILISVPKRKFKRAVKRNLIKRRVREAYRLHKTELFEAIDLSGRHLLLAFVYLDTEIASFADLEKAMAKTFRLLREKIQ